MSGPATMKLSELPPAQMISAPKDILTEILWRIDPADFRLRLRDEVIKEMLQVHLTSQAEILRLDAKIREIQATVNEKTAQLLS